MTKSDPFIVQVACIVVMKAASLKSRYQLGVEQLSVMTVPFSGDAVKMQNYNFISINRLKFVLLALGCN